MRPGFSGTHSSEALAALYEEAGSVLGLARLVGAPYGTVRNWLVQAGIPIKTRGWKAPKHRASYGPDHHNWKGGRHMRGDYWVVYAPGDPGARNGYVLEHRKVMADALGRPLHATELVHHRNGIKTDNRLDNLEVMTRSQHLAGHKHDAPRTPLGRFAK